MEFGALRWRGRAGLKRNKERAAPNPRQAFIDRVHTIVGDTSDPFDTHLSSR